MRRSMSMALAAAADAGVRKRLPFLLAAVGIPLAEMCCDGSSAKTAVEQWRPDLLVADVHLPQMDGCALAEQVLRSPDLLIKPRVMLLYRREFPVPDRAKLEDMGAVYLAWPAEKDAFCAAVDALSEPDQALSPELLRRADALLDALGVPVHAGREAIKCASILCAEDQRLLRSRGGTLYPMVGQMLGIGSDGVERAMRHAISAAWQSNQLENQHRIFADTVDAGRGQPTCGEMIARLADILRLEG